jgi:nucleotide-binding universal stress UspA family protein
MQPIRSILHPTDFSEHSEWAFHLASALARDHGARLIVLHVNPTPVFRGELVTEAHPNRYHDQVWNKLQGLIVPGPGVPLECQLADGKPQDEILRVARENHCDLIVLGTLGRTGLPRLVMGSVAEQVMRKASCPVLTVRTPLPDGSTSKKPHEEMVP